MQFLELIKNQSVRILSKHTEQLTNSKQIVMIYLICIINYGKVKYKFLLTNQPNMLKHIFSKNLSLDDCTPNVLVINVPYKKIRFCRQQ